MAGDPQKTPLVQTQAAFANRVASDAIARLGQGLPCHITSISGQIVTVAFDVAGNNATLPPVTIPIVTSHYDWIPLQVGDKGFTVAATVNIGAVSGQATGTAGFAQPGNLTALVFVPVANSAWTASDASQRVVQGPHGVVVQDMDGHTILTVNNSGTVTVKCSAFIVNTLPTSPGASGQFWNSAGTVKVS